MTTKSKPKRAEWIPMSVRVAPDLSKRFRERAESQARTASQQLRWLMEQDVREAEKEAA